MQVIFDINNGTTKVTWTEDDDFMGLVSFVVNIANVVPNITNAILNNALSSDNPQTEILRAREVIALINECENDRQESILNELKGILPIEDFDEDGEHECELELSVPDDDSEEPLIEPHEAFE